ncbi:MAG: LysR family transcriptional regulator [Pigmentiphaga sp.]
MLPLPDSQGDSQETITLAPNFRRLRIFMGVVQWGGVRRTAQKLHLTQPTVTRAVQNLEGELGELLFERSSQGMRVTPIGTLVAVRARRALAQLAQAEAELRSCRRPDRHGLAVHHLGHSLSSRHLLALIATADYGAQSTAATHLQVSQPAINQALSDLEQLVGTPLLLRASSGMVTTPAGEILIRRGKLALAEITAVSGDIAVRAGIVQACVRVGVLPLSGTLLVPQAVGRLLEEHCSLQVSLLEGAYDTLLQDLRCGDLDLIVGPLRAPCPTTDVVQERLFDATLSVIARKGHPLEKRKALTLPVLNEWGWVLPRRGTPAHNMIMRIMHDSGVSLPHNTIESNGLATIRALLVGSNRLSMISRHQIYFEERDELLCVLPVALHDTSRPIGITTRVDAAHSAGVSALLKHLRSVNKESLLAVDV